MREFYCIKCRGLHKVDVRNDHSIRILSTGYHIYGGQRYQICICDPNRLHPPATAVNNSRKADASGNL